MTLSSPSNPQLSGDTVLSQAAIAYRTSQTLPPSPEVVAALLESEKTARKQPATNDFSSLKGQWRLCFTTGVKRKKQGGINLGRGFYLPQFITANLGFGDTGISNQLKVGPFTIRFTGPLNYAGKRNILYFDFLHLQVKFGDFILYQGDVRGGKEKAAEFSQEFSQEFSRSSQLSQKLSPKLLHKLPFFAFFRITPNWIAARGRGGGLAMWIKEE